MRIRSPSKAPPENGDEGSTARMPTRLPRARKAPTTALVNDHLPTPRLRASPLMAARPGCDDRADITHRSAGWPSSTSEISRATARGAPALAASTRAGTSTDLPAISEISGLEPAWNPTLNSLLGNAHDQCVSLPPAAAQSGHPHAATTAFELQDKVQGDPGPRHADGVPDSDRASVDVDLVRVDAKEFGGCQSHCGERLVDLDLVEINEAFAAVGLASTKLLGIDTDKVNVNGGAIAVGHPIGMSGARITLHLVLELKRRGGGVGVAALCGGGGQGDALIVRVPQQ